MSPPAKTFNFFLIMFPRINGLSYSNLGFILGLNPLTTEVESGATNNIDSVCWLGGLLVIYKQKLGLGFCRG